MNDEFQYKFDLLKQEIDLLQNGIRSYDGTLFTIKGWAITVFSAFIFFAADKRKPIFLFFCAIAVILFWLLDAVYKSIQRNYIRRYKKIESFLQSSEFEKAILERSFNDFKIPDTVSNFYAQGVEKYKKILKNAFRLHNALLYVSMLILVGGLSLVIK